MAWRGTAIAFGKLATTEHDEQSAFFSWWTIYAQSLGIPERLCFAIPNGAKLPWARTRKGKRYSKEANKLKKEGLRPGVLDVILLIPSGGFHALLLEFKKRGNKPSPEQEAFLFDARGLSYNALVVWSCDEAIYTVKKYLSQADALLLARFPQLSRLTSP